MQLPHHLSPHGATGSPVVGLTNLMMILLGLLLTLLLYPWALM